MPTCVHVCMCVSIHILCVCVRVLMVCACVCWWVGDMLPNILYNATFYTQRDTSMHNITVKGNTGQYNIAHI